MNTTCPVCGGQGSIKSMVDPCHYETIACPLCCKSPEVIEVVKTDNDQAYLGDGLYVDHDGYQVRLYASDGISVTNEVFLDPRTLESFLIWVESKWIRRNKR
jgi:hypothetical protein